MGIASIIQMVNRGAELVDEGLAIYESVKGVIDSGKETFSEDDLQEAKARMEASIRKAQNAHDRLDAAIAKRLGS